MFASIRRYRLIQGSLDELRRRVAEGFANQISAQPGFRAYQFMDCGDGIVMTISMFSEAHEAEASRELAQRWTEERTCRISASPGWSHSVARSSSAATSQPPRTCFTTRVGGAGR